jgi:hypothetical protein
VSECLGALLRVSPSSVGESRLSAAFEPLRDRARDVAGTASEHVAFISLATLRRDEALDHLLAVVRTGPHDRQRARPKSWASIGATRPCGRGSKKPPLHAKDPPFEEPSRNHRSKAIA